MTQHQHESRHEYYQLSTAVSGKIQHEYFRISVALLEKINWICNKITHSLVDKTIVFYIVKIFIFNDFKFSPIIRVCSCLFNLLTLTLPIFFSLFFRILAERSTHLRVDVKKSLKYVFMFIFITFLFYFHFIFMFIHKNYNNNKKFENKISIWWFLPFNTPRILYVSVILKHILFYFSLSFFNSFLMTLLKIPHPFSITGRVHPIYVMKAMVWVIQVWEFHQILDREIIYLWRDYREVQEQFWLMWF